MATTYRETFNRHFEALRTCAVKDVPGHGMAILEGYILATKPERKELSEGLCKWAEAHAIKKPLVLGYARLLSAHHLFLAEQYDLALPLLADTKDLLTAQNDLNAAAFCGTMIGSVYRTLGNTDLALRSLLPAHEQLKGQATFEHPLLASAVAIGGIYTERKHYEEAIPLFESSFEIAERSNRFYWTIYALHGLGKIYLAQKKYPDARDCLEKAMAVTEKYGHPLSICNSMSELGNYHFEVGDYARAAEYHEQALELREKNGFIGGALTSYAKLGEEHAALFRPEEAIAVLEKGMKLAQQANLRSKMVPMLLLLSEIYHRKNGTEKSLFHYKQYHDLYVLVDSEDDERKIKNAKTIFEAEQTRKENIIIKKQKEEIEKKNTELQETIDALTLARIGKKARAITLLIAIGFFVFEDTILHYTLAFVNTENYFISIGVKMAVIFSLAPINKVIEKYLLKKVVRKRQDMQVAALQVQ